MVDMSARAVSGRLKRVSELRRLCLALRELKSEAIKRPLIVKEAMQDSDYQVDKQQHDASSPDSS